MYKNSSLLLCILFATSFRALSQNKPVPQITLSNSIYYNDTTFTDLPGNGFLIDIGNEILAVTCKHALWLNRAKEMKTIDFKGNLKEWKMVVLNDPSQYVILGDLLNVNTNEFIGERNTDRDYLVFNIKENHSRLTPLKLCSKPVQAGDTVYLVGWTFRTKTSVAQPRTAKVYGYLGASLLANSIVQENLAGLSGSPVVSKDNQLVAIVSGWKLDMATNIWFNASCSTDYLWEVLYSYWLKKNQKEKSIRTFQDYLKNYGTLNRDAPQISSYLLTELFYNDWLKSKGIKYGSMESYTKWTSEVLKNNGLTITADSYRKSLLVFDSWKERYIKGTSGVNDIEVKLAEAKVPIPNFIDFCEYAQELSAAGKHDKSIALLLYADEKIQHMGQIYAYLGDSYLAKGEKVLAKEAYLKCLKTYPEYPKASEGLSKLELK